MNKRTFFWLLCRAWICIVAINAPQLYAYWVSSGDSPQAFQDVIDESLYLRIAIDQGNYRPQEAIYQEHSDRLPLTKLLTNWRPDQTYSHFLVGRIATALGLRVQELNLVLDLASGVIGYIAIFWFFGLLLGQAHFTLAELCGVSFLCFPWIASLENLLNMHTLWPAFTGTVGPIGHNALPIQEGVESQLATVWFAITMVAFIRAGKDHFNSRGRIALLGIASGFGIYVYVLEWVAVSVLVPFLLCAMYLTHPKGALGLKLTQTLLIWSACHFTTALPGIAQIQAIRSAKHIFRDDRLVYQVAYYAPVEWLILIALGAVALWLSRDRWSNLTRLLLALAVSTLIAEICILNIQPIVGVATVALFIMLDFTRPLLSSLTVALLLIRYSRNTLFAHALKGLVLVSIMLASCRTYIISTLSQEEMDRLTPLVSFVRKEIPRDSVIAMLTYQRPFQSSTKEWDWRWQPNALGALTQTHLLKEEQKKIYNLMIVNK
jgi:hypothetical protein